MALLKKLAKNRVLIALGEYDNKKNSSPPIALIIFLDNIRKTRANFESILCGQFECPKAIINALKFDQCPSVLNTPRLA